MKRKTRLLIIGIVLFAGLIPTLRAQQIGLKTNLLYWGTTTPNAGLEFRMGKKWTLDVSGGYNPFTFSHHRKLKHWLVAPELRYWTCEAFSSHFFGLHGIGGEYNVNDIDIPIGRLKKLNNYRYKGYAIGAGLTYGYQWLLGKRWNLEASISGGFVHFDYDKFECAKCGKKIAEGKYDYFGVTKATLSLIYIIK
ncbi:DUF3575 domain-containing protein [Porphyromonas gingivalis]|uniref:DUF3575 domain-containing protein n=1 Tax=Porphyromonas gingivalis TaxID=837 RepID=UPI001F31CF69|nr:DUF3575 domain-containing protein [Porphyromonas gingivalis]MCE8189449.1 DUF3575 domain-containing protein [Porphyromonas gingivalis]